MPCVILSHAAVITPDLDRLRRFYEDVIGLNTLLVEHPQGAPFRRMAAISDTSGTAMSILVLEIPGYESGLPDDLVARRGRIDHLAFSVATDREFAAIVQRLVDAGSSAGRVLEVGPMRTVLFVDPDGGHHQLQTANPGWMPASSSEIVDRDALRRVLGREPEPPPRLGHRPRGAPGRGPATPRPASTVSTSPTTPATSPNHP